MITTITIRQQAAEAIEWASKQFGPRFRVQSNFPSNTWSFKFDDSKQAMLFALKWGC